MKNSQKGFIVSVLLAIIAVLVIGGGVYVYQNKKAEAPILPTDTEVQTTNQVQQQTNAQNSAVNTQTNNSKQTDKLINILLTSQDPKVLSVARDTLAQIADSSTVEAIAKAYHELKVDIVDMGNGIKYDKNGLKKSSLMGAMLRVRSPQAVPALREIILNDSDFSLKSQAVIALGAIGDKDSIQALLDGIAKSTSTSFTRVLVETLTAINNKESLPQLIELLNNSTNENIRYGAAGALGNISSETSITALKNALQKESSQLVKQRIQLSLKMLGQS